jgi:RNA polymerase sigma-70 factor (ECF subfamily)
MVMGVCRQVLFRHHDAEDAFQATFLVLARKAATIQNRRALAHWLYEVAYRVSHKMRSWGYPRLAPLSVSEWEAPSGEPHVVFARKELGRRLREKLDTLPQNYRFLMVQCYLEGKTNQEVARLLNRPIGTITGWLSRARGMLRERLSGTGLDLDGVPGRAGLASIPLPCCDAAPRMRREPAGCGDVRFA